MKIDISSLPMILNASKNVSLLLVVLMAGRAFAADGRPNVVFILGDDQAWTDYGFMEHEVVQTPSLDALAQRSLVFKKGYVVAPLCRPSLASIATGLYPFQHGITGNDVDGRNNRAELDAPLRAAFHQYPSFIKLLTSNGYLAHQSGKWWEGSWKDGGFTGGMTHGDPERGGRHGDEGLKIGRESMSAVKDFIEDASAQKKPFLLWYAPFLPHTPHNPPSRLLEKYAQPGRADDVAKYYAMCEWFDETCGELLGFLDQKGLTENTLVIYLNDNGWAAVSTNAEDPNQRHWGGFALRSKGSPFENGIRTPILISWPGHVLPQHSTDLAHAVDIFPTIAAATGLERPVDLPGINLLDENLRKERDTVFGVCNSIHNITLGDPDDTLQYLWCVQGDWKLLLRYDGHDTTQYRKVHAWDTKPVRLYNLDADPQESVELSASHPEVVERLRKRIDAWHSVKKSTR